MLNAKTNGTKWREAHGTQDPAAPQPMPTAAEPGQTPIAELVIADLRARAEAGEAKYGTKLYAHNGRSALVDLYQELLDGAKYVRQEIEERKDAEARGAEVTEAWRSMAVARHGEAVGAVMLPLLDAIGWDEAGGVEPIEHARRVVADREALAASLIEMRARAEKAEGERTVRDQVIADFRAGLAEVEIKWSADTARASAAEAERDAARRDLAEERDAAIAAEARAGQAALDLVAERHRHAAEVENLYAGLRALAGIRDEGAAETHRWQDRALAAESAAERERAKNDELFARMEAEASDRPENDELSARVVALVDRVSALRVAVRAARARAQKAERSAEGHHNDADVLSGDLDVAIAERDEARAEIDRLRGLIAQAEAEQDVLQARVSQLTKKYEIVARERDEAVIRIDQIGALVTEAFDKNGWHKRAGTRAEEILRAEVAAQASERRDLARMDRRLGVCAARLRTTRRLAQSMGARASALEAEKCALSLTVAQCMYEVQRWRDLYHREENALDLAKRRAQRMEEAVHNLTEGWSEIEAAIRRHLPAAEGYEDSDSPLRMVESAGSTIEFTAKQVRAAWGELDTNATPSPVPYPGALRSGEGLAEAIRAQVSALRGERDDLVVQLGAKTREVEEARRDRDAAAKQIGEFAERTGSDLAEAQKERDEARTELEQIADLLTDFDDDQDPGADPIELVRRCVAQESRNTAELCEVWSTPGLHILAEDDSSAVKVVQRVIGERDLAVSFAVRGWRDARRWHEVATVRADIAARLHDVIDPEGHWSPDGLIERVRALQDQAEAATSAGAIEDQPSGYPPSGAPDPEPAVNPVEAPQATEAQPDPGEGWRLLGPEEVIELGDEWRSDGVREWVRRIAAPAPAPEPRTEVVVEERGTRFVIVRREVTT